MLSVFGLWRNRTLVGTKFVCRRNLFMYLFVGGISCMYLFVDRCVCRRCVVRCVGMCMSALVGECMNVCRPVLVRNHSCEIDDRQRNIY